MLPWNGIVGCGTDCVVIVILLVQRIGTTAVLLVQVLCYWYNCCVTVTTVVLLVQLLCYWYNCCVTGITAVLLLQLLCYWYKYCVTGTTAVLLV